MSDFDYERDVDYLEPVVTVTEPDTAVYIYESPETGVLIRCKNDRTDFMIGMSSSAEATLCAILNHRSSTQP